MSLSVDMNVEPIEPEGNLFKFKLSGTLNSVEFIDSSRPNLEKIAQMIGEKLEMLRFDTGSEDEEESPLESTTPRPRRISNRIPVVESTVATTGPKPVKPLDVPVRTGLVRQLSQKMAEVKEKKPASEKAEVSPPLNSVRKAENFHKYRQAFQDSAAKKKPSAEQIDKYKAQMGAQAAAQPSSLEAKVDAEAKRPTTANTSDLPKAPSAQILTKPSSKTISRSSSSQTLSRSNSDKKEPVREHRTPPPEQDSPKPDVKSMITSFSPSRRKINRVESDKVQPLVVLPQRRLRDSPFYQESKSHRKNELALEGIGKEEMEARKQLFKKKRPEKKALDGRTDGLSKRNSSLYKEYKKKRPTVSSYVPGQANTTSSEGIEEEDDYTEEDDEEESTTSAPSSPVENVAAQLCLPRITSTSYYYEIFEKSIQEDAPVPPEIMDLAGKQYRSTYSHLERVVHIKHKLPGVSHPSEEDMALNHISYSWNGQDTVNLIEKQFFKEGRIMYQAYQSNESDRVLLCLPAAMAYSQAILSQVSNYIPFRISSLDSSLIVRDEVEVGMLQDWAESECSLSAWTGLRARFEDRVEVEFGLSFSHGLEIESALLGQNAQKIQDFLCLQFKKVLLDAVYTGYDAVVLALPPKRNVAEIAQEAITAAIEEVEYHLPPQFKIFYPEYDS